MKAHFFVRTAAAALAALIISVFLPVCFAADFYPQPFSDTPGGGNTFEGRLGDNYNSPSANGGGSASDSGSTANNGEYADTTEDAQVLGVTDTDDSATVGIVIAMLIAVAVIVLIIALIPRGNRTQ